jgi:hypothetical protein
MAVTAASRRERVVFVMRVRGGKIGTAGRRAVVSRESAVVSSRVHRRLRD